MEEKSAMPEFAYSTKKEVRIIYVTFNGRTSRATRHSDISRMAFCLN